MIEVEIRRPIFDEEEEKIRYVALALVRVEEGEISIGPGDPSYVLFEGILNLATGKPVHPREDPENWARNLPYAYRDGDLVAVLLRDDDGNPVDRGHVDDPEPVIPEMPAPTVTSAISC